MPDAPGQRRNSGQSRRAETKDNPPLPTVSKPQKSTGNPDRKRTDDRVASHHIVGKSAKRGPVKHVKADLPEHELFLHEIGCFKSPEQGTGHTFSMTQDLIAHAIVRRWGHEALNKSDAWGMLKSNNQKRVVSALLKFFGCDDPSQLPEEVKACRKNRSMHWNPVGLLLPWVREDVRKHLLATADFTAAEHGIAQLEFDLQKALNDLEIAAANPELSDAERSSLDDNVFTYNSMLGQTLRQRDEFRDVLRRDHGDRSVVIPSRAYGFTAGTLSEGASKIVQKRRARRSRRSGTREDDTREESLYSQRLDAIELLQEVDHHSQGDNRRGDSSKKRKAHEMDGQTPVSNKRHQQTSQLLNQDAHGRSSISGGFDQAGFHDFAHYRHGSDIISYGTSSHAPVLSSLPSTSYPPPGPRRTSYEQAGYDSQQAIQQMPNDQDFSLMQPSLNDSYDQGWDVDSRAHLNFAQYTIGARLDFHTGPQLANTTGTSTAAHLESSKSTSRDATIPRGTAQLGRLESNRLTSAQAQGIPDTEVGDFFNAFDESWSDFFNFDDEDEQTGES